jgi:hypothetical protein
MSDKKKIDGLIVKKNEKSPEWVLTSVSVEVESFKKWLDENKNGKGWVNLDLKKTKDGRYYLDHNDYKPKESVPF